MSARRHRLIDFEQRGEPLASPAAFRRRLLLNFLVACLFIGVSLFAGMSGYHFFEGMSWVDAYVNASMILSGMGPVSELKTASGKVFAGTYALYSGLMVVLATGLIIAPIVHRVMHRFHVADEAEEKDDVAKVDVRPKRQ